MYWNTRAFPIAIATFPKCAALAMYENTSLACSKENVLAITASCGERIN
jgi:hypothetical protein